VESAATGQEREAHRVAETLELVQGEDITRGLALLSRLEVVGQSTAALRKALGPHCPAVGLGTLGTAALHASWTDAEEALLEEGMRAWGRDFRQARPPSFGACRHLLFWALDRVLQCAPYSVNIAGLRSQCLRIDACAQLSRFLARYAVRWTSC